MSLSRAVHSSTRLIIESVDVGLFRRVNGSRDVIRQSTSHKSALMIGRSLGVNIWYFEDLVYI